MAVRAVSCAQTSGFFPFTRGTQPTARGILKPDVRHIAASRRYSRGRRRAGRGACIEDSAGYDMQKAEEILLKLVALVAFLAAFAGCYWIVRDFKINNERNEAVREEEATLRKNLPKKLDDVTMLDDIRLERHRTGFFYLTDGPSEVLKTIYSYSVTVPKETLLQSGVQARLKELVCKQPEMAKWIGERVTATFTTTLTRLGL